MEGRSYMRLGEAASEMGKGRDALYRLAKRKDDPLPLRYFPGDRYGFLIVGEFNEWLKRNTVIGGNYGGSD